MTTKTISPELSKTDIVFNVFLNEDTSTDTFLQSIIAKDTYKWAMIREAFKGKDNVSLTLVDKYAETPFQCILLAKICNQLKKELEFNYGLIRILVSKLKNESHSCIVKADGKFGTTMQRDMFLEDCIGHIAGMPCKVTSKRNLIRCRDLKLQTDDFTLFIRVEGGISKGWQIKDKYVAALSACDILRLHEHDIPCHNQYIHGFDRNGVFLSIELQPNLNS